MGKGQSPQLQFAHELFPCFHDWYSQPAACPDTETDTDGYTGSATACSCRWLQVQASSSSVSTVDDCGKGRQTLQLGLQADATHAPTRWPTTHSTCEITHAGLHQSLVTCLYTWLYLWLRCESADRRLKVAMAVFTALNSVECTVTRPLSLSHKTVLDYQFPKSRYMWRSASSRYIDRRLTEALGTSSFRCSYSCPCIN